MPKGRVGFVAENTTGFGTLRQNLYGGFPHFCVLVRTVALTYIPGFIQFLSGLGELQLKKPLHDPQK